ncbi:MAG TPA: type II secretion system F family protein, partial [Nitrospiria bacterium]|nr:type II secretion system F family protein [Nitrospiria bacterium]
MATFAYVGRTQQGILRKGELTAKNRDEVVAVLRKQKILPTSIREKGGAERVLSMPKFGAGVGDKDLAIFTRQFSTMIDAGLPLVQCLEILASQTENKTLATAVAQLRLDVESGSTYADALKKHPKIFDDLYRSLVAAGEAGGILDTILNRLSKHIEKTMALKGKIKSAMVYPSVIVVVAVVVVSILLVWVIPIFAKMFSDFGGTLPAMTQMVIGFSHFAQHYWWIIGGVMIGVFFAIKWWYGTPSGHSIIDALLLKVPVVGDLIRKSAVAKFTRTLGTLISSGVPILDGLAIVSKTAGNVVIERAIMNARQSISEGKTVSEPLGASKVFPPMVVQMIAVGETTGALDAMLGKIADFYDEEVDAGVSKLTALLEPALMVFLGVVIGFLV